jgi:hypothetical protein
MFFGNISDSSLSRCFSLVLVCTVFYSVMTACRNDDRTSCCVSLRITLLLVCRYGSSVVVVFYRIMLSRHSISIKGVGVALTPCLAYPNRLFCKSELSLLLSKSSVDSAHSLRGSSFVFYYAQRACARLSLGASCSNK